MMLTTETVIVVVLVDVPANVAVTTAPPLSVAEVALTTFPVIEIKVLVVVNVVRKSVETSITVPSYSLANKLMVAAVDKLTGAIDAGLDGLAIRVKSVLMISSGPAVGDRVLTVGAAVGDPVGARVVTVGAAVATMKVPEAAVEVLTVVSCPRSTVFSSTVAITDASMKDASAGTVRLKDATVTRPVGPGKV